MNTKSTANRIEQCLYGEMSSAVAVPSPHKQQVLTVSSDDDDADDAEEISLDDDCGEEDYDPLLHLPPKKSKGMREDEMNVNQLVNKFQRVTVDDVSGSKESDHIILGKDLDNVIDLVELRRLASSGISDVKSHRGVAWRVLLGYLPAEVKRWEGHLLRERTLYKEFVEELFVSNSSRIEKEASKCNSSINKSPSKELLDIFEQCGRDGLLQELNSDEALNTLVIPSSHTNKEALKEYVDNATLLDEIRKDVIRTHPGLNFYLETQDDLGKRRYAALERILFVWSKLNQGVRYVQGMNEIIGTIFFVLANDAHREWSIHAEPDAYHLFNIIMVQMRDVYMSEMDETETGLHNRISSMMRLLSQHDPVLASHFNKMELNGSYFAVRWLTTLLGREFSLPETVRLWDSLFASTDMGNFLKYFCTTMLMAIRNDLLQSDFGNSLRLLQNYPLVNRADMLLNSARALWIYESQVTLCCRRGGVGLDEALNSIQPPPDHIIMAYGLYRGRVTKTSPRTATAHKLLSSTKEIRQHVNTFSKSLGANAKAVMNEWEVKLQKVQQEVRRRQQLAQQPQQSEKQFGSVTVVQYHHQNSNSGNDSGNLNGGDIAVGNNTLSNMDRISNWWNNSNNSNRSSNSNGENCNK